MKTQPEAAGVSPTQDSRGNEGLHEEEEEEDYRAGKADGPSGTHTTPMAAPDSDVYCKGS